MEPITHQENLSLWIYSPLGSNAIIIEEFEGYEGISEPFHYKLLVHSDDINLDFYSLLRKEIVVSLNGSESPRYFGGIVGKICQRETLITDDKQRAYYEITLHPALWLLNFTKDYRIFQYEAPIDIIKKILEENGVQMVTNYVFMRGFIERTFCVQYGETAFDFITRLMEEEGIFYYFTHDENGHTLVLCDDSLNLDGVKDFFDLPLIHSESAQPYLNTIRSFSVEESIVPKEYQSTDYNYRTSRTPLHPKVNGEGLGGSIYEHPGYFENLADGEEYADVRLNELEWQRTIAKGKGFAPHFLPGHVFELYDHPREELNKNYVLLNVHHKIKRNYKEQNNSEDGYPQLALIYENKFEGFPEGISFRPKRLIQKPRIYSNQTAIVTGPPGSKIYCDELGRVKVQFHWDIRGQRDESSSCWIRVAQNWAGSNWGGLVTPRVDMEVVVTFIEGDPDRPLIIGCVYNNENTPPEYTTESLTKSTFKTNSSIAGVSGSEDDTSGSGGGGKAGSGKIARRSKDQGGFEEDDLDDDVFEDDEYFGDTDEDLDDENEEESQEGEEESVTPQLEAISNLLGVDLAHTSKKIIKKPLESLGVDAEVAAEEADYATEYAENLINITPLTESLSNPTPTNILNAASQLRGGIGSFVSAPTKDYLYNSPLVYNTFFKDAEVGSIAPPAPPPDPGFNEFRFEDLKGEEEIYTHAQKDVKNIIEHNRYEEVKGEEDYLLMPKGSKYVIQQGVGTEHKFQINIGDHLKEILIGNESTTITQGSQTLDITMGSQDFNIVMGEMTRMITLGDYSIDITLGDYSDSILLGDHSTDIVLGDHSTDIVLGDHSTDIVLGNYSTDIVLGDYSTSIVKGDVSTEVKKGNITAEITKGDYEVTVTKGDHKTEIKVGNLSIKLGAGNIDISVTGDIKIEATGDISLKAGKNIKMEAGLDIKSKAGVNIKNEGGVGIENKAGVKNEMKGTLCVIQGSLTKIN